MQELGHIISNALLITGFVFVMMVVIEYLNVLSRGHWQDLLARWKWGQSVLCATLGVIPGCLGAFAVASLYMHRVVSIGAVVAAMIATCGDEAFVMLALFPRQALFLFALLFAIGVCSGMVVDLITRARRTTPTGHLADYRATHPETEACTPFSRRELIRQWKACSPHRGWLTLMLLLFIAGAATGRIGHQDAFIDVHLSEPGAATQSGHAGEPAAAAQQAGAHEGGWFKITVLLVGLIGLAIVATVPDHFLDEHLWNHIARVHAWRIFLWTTLALLVTHLLIDRIDMSSVFAEHRLPLLLMVCLLGIIPESGPHLVVVSLYVDGALPFSTLLASSIVQDGHGMIPMLAHSRRAFLLIKAINFAVGLGAGLLGLALGW